jgi:hypothetical protein
MKNDMIIICSNCGTQGCSTTEACIKCGSLQKTVKIDLYDKLTVVDQIHVKKKQGTGKRKVKLDWIEGYEENENGDLIYKERTIDYEQNKYFEHIKTIDGKTLRLCDELLSDHQNRGYAKYKKK